MFKHYVTAALRLIKRTALFSTINMLGFIMGIAAAFFIYLWIVDELTFEDFHKNKDSIYRVVEVSVEPGGKITESSSTVGPLAQAFRHEFPQIKNATLIKYEDSSSFQFEDKIINGKQVFVDSCFFDLFSFPTVAGNPLLIKNDPNNVVLSDEFAYKMFGNSSPIGKQIFYEFFDKYTYFTVVGVVKIPRKSHIQFDVAENWQLRSFLFDWHRYENVHVYVQMNDNYSISKKDRLGMSKLLNKHTGKKELLYFQPLTDIHLRTQFSDPVIENHGNISQIYLFAVLAMLIIFMGSFNFTTLSTAQASIRYKEVGVRKVTGAKRKTLITQFLSESIVQAFISLALALALTELLLPLFNQIVDKDISLTFNWQTILFIFLGIFVVGCLAGSYPAFYLSTINPLLAFKGGQKTGKKGNFIKALVCVQFIIAIILILCSSTMFKQLHYMQNQDLGLDKENIISVRTNLWYDNYVDVFKREVLKNPNVISVAMGVDIVDYVKGNSWEKKLMEWNTPDGKTDSLEFVQIWGDGSFIKTFGIELLKGKLYENDPKAYWDHTYDYPALINETAWKRMGVDDPLGIPIKDKNSAYNRGVIVGVVKDFNYQTLRETIKPMYITYSPENMTWVHIRISPDNQQETIKFIEKKFIEAHPPFNKSFEYRYFSDALNKNYEREQQQSHIVLTFTILAIVIAMMGVFGLVSLSTRQRTKEIGVRKVIGAHTWKIIIMFCREYMRWLLIAFIIACPLAYVIMDNWLNSFAYRTSLSWWLFPLAGLIIFIITLATVIIQTYRTASQNPVTSLRYE